MDPHGQTWNPHISHGLRGNRPSTSEHGNSDCKDHPCQSAHQRHQDHLPPPTTPHSTTTTSPAHQDMTAMSRRHVTTPTPAPLTITTPFHHHAFSPPPPLSTPTTPRHVKTRPPRETTPPSHTTRQNTTATLNDTTTTQTPHNGSNAGRARQERPWDGQEGTDGGTYKVCPFFIYFFIYFSNDY
jgi:hypothetical protein